MYADWVLPERILPFIHLDVPVRAAAFLPLNHTVLSDEVFRLTRGRQPWLGESKLADRDGFW